MALGNNNPVNTQTLRDFTLMQNVALPLDAAGALKKSNTNAIDLIQATPFPTTRYVQLAVVTTASTNGANNKNCNIYLQESSNDAGVDNVNTAAWTNCTLIANPLVKVTDAGNAAAAIAAQTVTAFLPSNVKRFIRLQAQSESGHGNLAADATMSLQLFF